MKQENIYVNGFKSCGKKNGDCECKREGSFTSLARKTKEDRQMRKYQ